MRTVCICVLVLAMPTVTRAQSLKPWIVVAATAAGADIARTHYDLRHGARESNPFIPSMPVANTVALVSSYVFALTIAHELDIHGHHRAARWLATSVTVDATACVAHNFRLFRW